jgi:hypothetical protein
VIVDADLQRISEATISRKVIFTTHTLSVFELSEVILQKMDAILIIRRLVKKIRVNGMLDAARMHAYGS